MIILYLFKLTFNYLLIFFVFYLVQIRYHFFLLLYLLNFLLLIEYYFIKLRSLFLSVVTFCEGDYSTKNLLSHKSSLKI